MDILDRILAHNEWATRVLLEKCNALSADEYNREFEIGVGTLHKTLAHIINAMNSWAAIMTTDAPGERRDLSQECSIPDELFVELAKAHAALTNATTSLRDGQRLDEIAELVHPVTKMRYRFTRGSMAAHVITHGMHHRAQVLQMLRQLGHTELPDIDLLEWEIQASVGSREPASE